MSADTSGHTTVVSTEEAAPVSGPPVWRGGRKVRVIKSNEFVFCIESGFVVQMWWLTSAVCCSTRWGIIMSTEMIWGRSGRSAGRRASGTEVLYLSLSFFYFKFLPNFILWSNRQHRKLKWLAVWYQGVWLLWVYISKCSTQVFCCWIRGAWNIHQLLRRSVYIFLWQVKLGPLKTLSGGDRCGNGLISTMLQIHRCLVYARFEASVEFGA